MTACAPLCSLAGVQRVTSRSPSQTQLCQKRVAGVRHPANSAQPKVAGEPGGRKKCRIKRGGRKRPSARETPPRRAGRGRSGGGHFSPPGVNSGVCFHKKPAVARFSRDLGGDIYEFQEEHHAKRKNSSSRCEFPLRRSNSWFACSRWGNVPGAGCVVVPCSAIAATGHQREGQSRRQYERK